MNGVMNSTIIDVPSRAVAVALAAELVLNVVHFEAEPQDDTTWKFTVDTRYANYVNEKLARLS